MKYYWSLAIFVPIIIIAPWLIFLLIPISIAGAAYWLSQHPKKKIFKESPYLHRPEKLLSRYTGGNYCTTDKKMCLPICFAESGIGSEKETPAMTLGELLKKAALRRPDKPALRVERPTPQLVGKRAASPLPLSKWKLWTWKQYYDECRIVARAFIQLGLEPYDGVSIFGFNSPEWFMAEIGCIMAGGIAAGIYPTDRPDQVTYKANHSSTVIAVVENNRKAEVFLRAAQKGDLEKLKVIVIWSSSDKLSIEVPAHVTVYNWSDLHTVAQKTSENMLEQRLSFQKPGNVCCYIYTSGTTGKPKAVMITHDNVIFEVASVNTVFKDGDIFGTKEEEERILSYLPLSHVAGMMVDIVFPIFCTATQPAWISCNFARPYDLKVGSVGDRLRTVRPTLFLGVPRVWEKIAEKMKALGAKTKGLKLHAVKFCKAQGLEHAKACQMGGSGDYPKLYNVAKILLDQIKEKLGLDKCKYGLTGAAPIQVETIEYFAALGILINEVYGMSECVGASTVSSPQAHVWGSCGWALPGCEVKIFNVSNNDINEKKACPFATNLFHPREEEQGEICFRGRNIMLGYMANPDLGSEHETKIKKKLTSAIDADGWLHSGDKGCADARGMIKITGRYKELIIGAGGENVAPVPIENHVKALRPEISNLMMLGDRKKYNVCFVTLKAKGATGEKPGSDELETICHSISPGVTTISGAMKDKKWIETIKKAIIDTNNNGEVCPSNASKIQKFSILPRDFSVETSELTPTLKLKRSVVQKMHSELVDRMYLTEGTYIPFYPPSQ